MQYCIFSLVILLYSFLFSTIISAQLVCDDESTPACSVSSSQSFFSDQIFSETILYINSNITCTTPLCSLEFNVSQIIFNEGHIEAHFITIYSDDIITNSTSSISVGNGTLKIISNKLSVSGVITGTYLNIGVKEEFNLNGNINADAYGHLSDSGPGAGQSINGGGGGGGYGGRGQDDCSGTAIGGQSYGTSVNPAEIGSGGGSDASFHNRGGNGGGAIFISAQSLVLNLGSLISANGQNAESGTSEFPNGAGGGSGGSVSLQTDSIALLGGLVQAKGGNAGNGFDDESGYVGGAGAGGRIYVNSSSPILSLSPNFFNASVGTQGCQTTSSNDGSVNAFCRSGYGANLHSCQICGVGQYSVSGSPCTYCAPGWITMGGGEDGRGSTNCTRCEAGTYESNNTKCIVCPRGSVSYAGASGSCTPCGTNRSISASECMSCDANTIADPILPYCMLCGVGFYSLPNSSSCSLCPSGTIGAGYGAGCTTCGAGYYVTSTFTGGRLVDRCEQCRPGFYSTGPSARRCTPCPEDTFSNSSASSSCTRCPYNSYSYPQASSCVYCQYGVLYRGRCNHGSTTRWNYPDNDNNRDYRGDGMSTAVGAGVIFAGLVTLGGFTFLLVHVCNRNRTRRQNNNNNNVVVLLPNVTVEMVEMVRVDQKSLDIVGDNLSPNPHYKPVSDATKDSASTGEGTCVICYDRPRNVSFTPCGHMIACHECTKHLTKSPNAKCPMCRSIIRSVSRVFL